MTLSKPIVAPSAFPLYSQAKHQRESERWSAAQADRVRGKVFKETTVAKGASLGASRGSTP